ncbi:MAG TPA: hypothetical protein VK761_03370, partial [Solirubrobacteraceae bacterium]|nr:hypothetical protein [Solirubrobacteraceae bacterium]
MLDELDEPEPDELLDAPTPPAEAAPLDEPLPDDEELSDDVEALLVPPPETVSPTSPESETIVPLCGAIRRVSATACSSLLTVSRSLLTAAFAEAMFASRVAELIVALLEDDDEPDEEPWLVVPLALPVPEPEAEPELSPARLPAACFVAAPSDFSPLAAGVVEAGAGVVATGAGGVAAGAVLAAGAGVVVDAAGAVLAGAVV